MFFSETNTSTFEPHSESNIGLGVSEFPFTHVNEVLKAGVESDVLPNFSPPLNYEDNDLASKLYDYDTITSIKNSAVKSKHEKVIYDRLTGETLRIASAFEETSNIYTPWESKVIDLSDYKKGEGLKNYISNNPNKIKGPFLFEKQVGQIAAIRGFSKDFGEGSITEVEGVLNTQLGVPTDNFLAVFDTKSFFLGGQEYFFDLKADDQVIFGVKPVNSNDWIKITPQTYSYEQGRVRYSFKPSVSGDYDVKAYLYDKDGPSSLELIWQPATKSATRLVDKEGESRTIKIESINAQRSGDTDQLIEWNLAPPINSIEWKSIINDADSPLDVSTSKDPLWLVIHGNNNNPFHMGQTFAGFTSANYSASDASVLINQEEKKKGFDGVGPAILEHNKRVAFLDWSDAANNEFDIFDYDTYIVGLRESASWIKPVAEETVRTLKEMGLGAKDVNLVGHSLGAYVAYEIAQEFAKDGEKVSKIIALDPAQEFPDGRGLGVYDTENVDFSEVADWSWAFVGNVPGKTLADNIPLTLPNFGSYNKAKTAHESFELTFPGELNPEAIHGNVHQAFADILKENTLGNPLTSYSHLFLLDNMTESQSIFGENQTDIFSGKIEFRQNSDGDWEIDKFLDGDGNPIAI